MKIHSACLATVLAAAASLATAQTTWPDKPIRIIVPLPPGGPSDIVLRSAAEKMQATLKQPLIIDNKPGAAEETWARARRRAPRPTATHGCGRPTRC